MTSPVSVWAAAPAAAAKAPAAAPAQPTKDPAAMAALDRMGATLRGLQSFGLSLDITNEEVLDSGQKIQRGGSAVYSMRRPNAFRVETNTELVDRTIVYDGKIITLFSPDSGFYATIPAPGTITETLEAARDKLGLELPITDLFIWGTDPSMPAAITSALSIGPDAVGGQRCQQYAFRQEGLDWQIWLRDGDQALPCKIVISATDDPTMPQFTAVFNWRLQETFAADAFAFAPPQGARQIEFHPPQSN
jgi:hypothetical protein